MQEIEDLRQLIATAEDPAKAVFAAGYRRTRPIAPEVPGEDPRIEKVRKLIEDAAELPPNTLIYATDVVRRFAEALVI